MSDHPGRQALYRTPEEDEEYLRLLEQEQQWREDNRLFLLYPDEGPLRRELYQKHLAHFAAGRYHTERCLLGANRSGKSMACTYEHVCHLIGWYPPWWQGFRFDRPVVGWAAGEDNKAVRDSLQQAFLGPPERIGSGLIPRQAIIRASPRSGVPEAVDTVQIRSFWGGTSRLSFKSYDSGREAFQAAKIDVMQFDEEPPQDVYSEGLTRIMSTDPGMPNGLVICGFTPLKGLSGVVLSYMPGGSPTEGAVTGS